MNRATLGALIGAGLVLAAFGTLDRPTEVFAQRSMPGEAAAGGGQMIALSTPIGDKAQQVTVIDPRQRVISVYHIDLASGKIALRSVRNIHWDLQMTYLNNESPLPQEIRALLEQR